MKILAQANEADPLRERSDRGASSRKGVTDIAPCTTLSTSMSGAARSPKSPGERRARSRHMLLSMKALVGRGYISKRKSGCCMFYLTERARASRRFEKTSAGSFPRTLPDALQASPEIGALGETQPFPSKLSPYAYNTPAQMQLRLRLRLQRPDSLSEGACHIANEGNLQTRGR